MFLDNSRYAEVPTVEAKDEKRRTVQAVKLRRLPFTAGTPTEVGGADRLDVMAQRKYGDGTKFWHIADANTELEANNLVKERKQDKETRIVNVSDK